MAEIALASSVAGLLSLAIQVADISHRYFSSVKSSSKTIKGYFRELEVLKLVLRKFDDLAKDPNTATHFSSENITIVDGCREELEDLRSKLHKRSSDPTFPKSLNRLTWPFAEDETQRLVAVIHRYQASFHAVLSADHFKFNVETLTEINKSTNEDAQEKLRTLVAWISPANPTSNHVTAREKHESMTGRWLLDSKTFAQWSIARQSSMWIYGIPGAGKTILCSTVIDSLLQNRQVGDAVAFFYFDYMDEQKQTLEAAIRSLISQLWSSYSEVPETIRRLWKSNQGPYRKGLLSNRELIDCFKESCKSFGKAQVVLDALDESSDRAPLLTFLEEMVKHSDGNIQLIVTSRQEQDIEETLMTLLLHPVSLDNKFVAADIRRHVHSSLEHDRKLKRMPTKLKHRIEDVLTQKAHGMFRWVECQLEVLGDCLTMASVEAALSDLPNTLDETYDRILENIDRQHLEYAQTAFALLIVTCRPLKVEELAEAVVVAPYCKAIDIDDRLFDPKDIIKICGGLVVWVADTNEVRFAHYSVREYLLSSRISSGSAASFALSWASAEQKIGEICLTYLLSFDERDSMYRDVMVDYPFLNYSMYYWHNHIHLHGHGNSASLPSLCATFFDAGRNHAYANWISMLDFEVYYDSVMNTEAEFEHPVTAMMAVGRRDIARTLLLDWRAWHSHGHDCDNALRLAAKTIDRMTLETLIGSGSEIIDERLAYPNILDTAASDAELVSEIIPSQVSGLARRSPILAQYWLCTVLDAAVKASHQQLVKILLEAGADVHVNGTFKDPDLVIAIQHCNNRDEVLEIVKMLLEHGAEIDCHSNAHRTALHDASGYCQNCHPQLARYLLDRGADNNVAGGENGTTLKAAIAGSQDLAAQFINYCADVNATAGWTGTPLQAATYTNHIDLMRLLIRSGADVNLAAPIAFHSGEGYCYSCGTPFPPYWMYRRAWGQFPWSELAFWEQASPIKIACQNGSLEAVKLLLDSGVNLEARETGHSTLRWSIVRSDWTASRREIVRLLIDAGDRLSSAKPSCLDGPNAMPVDRSRPSEADLEHLPEEWHQKFYSAMTDGSETQINDLIDTISRNLVD